MKVLKFVLIATVAGTAHAQSAGTQTEKQIRDVFINDARREAVKSVQQTSGFKPSDPTKLKKSIDGFSTATDAYRTALQFKVSPEQPLKNLEKVLIDLEKYFRTRTTPKINQEVYAKLSPIEFASETLKSADRLKADLPALLKISEDPYLLLNPEAQRFLLDLRHESLLLKYLASKSRAK